MRTITIENLSVGYYDKKKKPITVLSAVNATLHAGQLTCLIGSNGIGKSTLLRTLAAFQPALKGRIVYREHEKEPGKDIARMTNTERARMVSVVLTTKPDVRNLTVEELVGLGRSPYTDFWGRLSAEDHAVVAHSIKMVGIENLKTRSVQTLSDGERQKMMIAKALAQQTPVIILDEPTAFLDFRSKVDMLHLLKQLAHKTRKMVLLSTHDLEQALQLSDSIWVLKDDKTLNIYPPENTEALSLSPKKGEWLSDFKQTENRERTQKLLDIFAPNNPIAE